MPPKQPAKRGATHAWEQAAREACRERRELRRSVGEGGGNDSRIASARATPQSSRPGSVRGDTDRMSSPDSWLDASAMQFGPESPTCAMHLKAMAAKLRRKVHADALEQMAGGGSYASLDVEGLQDHGPNGDEASIVAQNGQWAALGSIFYHPFTLLLLALPLGIVSHLWSWGATTTFWLNILALIPLAKILGDGTEELASAIKNDTISGLLNATLGNAVEMILTVQTMRKKNLLPVVKATLLGSILSNILLVLGTSFLLGGLSGSQSIVGKHHVIYDQAYQARGCTMEKEQIFSAKSALVSMGMQLLACMTIALPTIFSSAPSEHAPFHVNGSDGQEARELVLLKVSRVAALIVMCSYVASIMFQLVTHKRMLSNDEGADSDDEEEPGGLSAVASLALMTVTTGIIAVSTELLVTAIEDVVQTSHLSSSFIGIVLLPFAGNACEHASAIRFAIQDRPGLSIGIAVGSSTQISLFVVPFAVVMGWVMDKPLDLAFGMMNTTVMLLSVLVALALVIDGRSNWLKGFMLCTAYAFEAVLYWYVPGL